MTTDVNANKSVVDRMAGILEPEASPEQPKEQESQADVQQETEEYIDEVAQEETQEPTELINETVEDEEITEPEIEQPQSYRVKVQGEEVEVPLDELLKGYSRTADYTKKSQSLAEQKKKVESKEKELDALNQLQARYAENLKALDNVLAQSEKDVDLEELKRTDESAYVKALAEKGERERQRAKLRAEQQRVQQEQATLQTQQYQKYLERQNDLLLEKMPEMKNTKHRNAVSQEIIAYGKEVGLTDQELNQVVDHRFVQILHEASQFKKLMKSKPEVLKKLKTAPKLMRAGVAKATSQSQQDNIKRAKSQLRKTGNVRDAARLFNQLL